MSQIDMSFVELGKFSSCFFTQLNIVDVGTHCSAMEAQFPLLGERCHLQSGKDRRRCSHCLLLIPASSAHCVGTNEEGHVALG